MKPAAKFFIIIFVLVASGCGGFKEVVDSTVPSGVNPIITRISPSAAKAGDTVTVFGIGFSAAPQLNTVIIGNAQAAADTYSLLANPSGDEVESITFVVPNGVTVGTQAIYVVVIDNPSNVDLTITINP